MNKKGRIKIIGAGPGGLASAMLLGSRGFDVEIFEKEDQPGGRTSEIRIGNYRFDVGPTFLMLKSILDEIFKDSGYDSEDYLKFISLSPMYRLIYPDDSHMDVYSERGKMKAELKRVFPGDQDGIDKFYERERKRYERFMPLLQHDNQSMLDIFSSRFIKGLPYYSIGNSVYDEMGKYFKNENARLSFTFQSKYLGMSPWDCPGAFGIVPYVEHEYNVYHVIGGLSEISRQMARVAEKIGVKINYNSKVKKVILKNKQAKGLELEDGNKIIGDEVIVNADFGYAMENLIPEGALKKYSSENLAKKKLSCSIFMMYLGVDKKYNLNHNTIVFAKNYKKNVDDVFSGRLTENDVSLYVRDHSSTDTGLAEQGKTALYVLVPIANKRSGIDWKAERDNLRKITLNALKNRLGMNDIEEHIEAEKVYTPDNWESDYNVYQGAVFNLAHNLGQMLWFRPHNEFEELDNLYLVGGGTHPGSGLPTIYESGRITTKLICKKYGINY